MDEIIQLDQQLMLWLNFDGGTLIDNLWWYVSKTWTWIPLYLVLIIMLWKRANLTTFIVLLVVTALVILMADQIASGILKPLVERPRPSRSDSGISEFIHTVRGYRGGHYGFVSSHAANTWGISLWFILLIRNWKTGTAAQRHKEHLLIPILIVWTILNCYSRIYLGVHYPGDILGGLIVGTVSAITGYYVLYPLGNKWFIEHKK